jgi:outer membrane protein assembly factor BamB
VRPNHLTLGLARWPLITLLVSGISLSALSLVRRPQTTTAAPAQIPTVRIAASTAIVGPILRSSLPVNLERGVQEPNKVSLQQHGGPRRQHRSEYAGPACAEVTREVLLPEGVVAQPTPCPDHSCVYVASLDGFLYKIDVASGQLRWKHELGGRSYASPAVTADGRVFAGSDSGKLWALDDRGKVLWKADAEGELDNAILLTSSEHVVVAAGKRVLAFRLNGNVAFRYEAKGKVYTAPAQMARGTIVFGSQDDRVYGISEAGLELFQVPLEGDVDGAPVIADDDTFFVGTDREEVVKLSATGTVLWRQKVGGYVRGALSVARNGDVLAGTFGPEPVVLRLASGDGSTVGKAPMRGTGSRDYGIVGAPLEDATGRLYWGGQDDLIRAFGEKGELWRVSLRGDVDAPVTLLRDGTLVAVSSKGVLAFIRSCSSKTATSAPAEAVTAHSGAETSASSPSP